MVFTCLGRAGLAIVRELRVIFLHVEINGTERRPTVAKHTE